jgi:hypothetical protein
MLKLAVKTVRSVSHYRAVDRRATTPTHGLGIVGCLGCWASQQAIAMGRLVARSIHRLSNFLDFIFLLNFLGIH